MKAAWPQHAAAVDSSAISQFESLKELVRGVRNARTEYGLEQAKKVGACGDGCVVGQGLQSCALTLCCHLDSCTVH